MGKPPQSLDAPELHHNHGIGVDSLIYGEDFDGENLDTLTPLIKKRFEFMVKRIKELDEFATV